MKINPLEGASVTVQTDGSLLCQHWHIDSEGEDMKLDEALIAIILWLHKKAIADQSRDSSQS